jgi:hypothetical protein
MSGYLQQAERDEERLAEDRQRRVALLAQITATLWIGGRYGSIEDAGRGAKQVIAYAERASG